MYAIEKKFSFSAAHLLVDLCKDHPCGSLHGHNYDVYIRIESDKLDDHGFIIDFNDLKNFKTKVIDVLFDHATIMTYQYHENLSKNFDYNNTTALFGKTYTLPSQYNNTTVENMCKHIYELLVQYSKRINFTNYTNIRIRMSENDSSFGEYSPSESRTENLIQRIEDKFGELEEDFVELKERVNELEEDFGELKGRLESLEYEDLTNVSDEETELVDMFRNIYKKITSKKGSCTCSKN